MRLAGALACALLAPACLVRVHRADLDEGRHEVRREQRAVRRVVTTDRAPLPVGPYSQAIVVGDTLHAAGQIGLDPASGALVDGGVAAQTRQALSNLEAVLQAAGFALADAVQVQVFLTDLGDYAAVNAVYAEVFGADPPARACVQVAALPKGASVEILLVAVRRG